MSYSAKNGSVLPITVYTDENLKEARRIASVRHIIFAGIYAAEVLVVFLMYVKMRKKVKGGSS